MCLRSTLVLFSPTNTFDGEVGPSDDFDLFWMSRLSSEPLSVLLMVTASSGHICSAFGAKLYGSALIASWLLLGDGSYLRLVIEKFLSFSVILFFEFKLCVFMFAPSCSFLPTSLYTKI